MFDVAVACVPLNHANVICPNGPVGLRLLKIRWNIWNIPNLEGVAPRGEILPIPDKWAARSSYGIPFYFLWIKDLFLWEEHKKFYRSAARCRRFKKQHTYFFLYFLPRQTRNQKHVTAFLTWWLMANYLWQL